MDPLYGLPTLEDLQQRRRPSALPNLYQAPSPVPEEVPFTPEQQKQYDLILKPRGALGELGAAAASTVLYDVPRTIGQGLKAFGKKGDMSYDIGQGIHKAIEPNRIQYMQDQNPDAHNAVTNTFSSAIRMAGPSLAPLAALPLAPVLGLGTLGATALVGATGLALQGPAQYQDTYEKMKAAGKSDIEAHQAGAKTGIIEGIGEMVGGPVLGRFLGAGGRMLAKKMDIPAALEAIRKPEFWKTFGRETARTAAIETGTEVAQGYGEAYVEKSAGLNVDPYHEAVSAIGPTMALTALLTPWAAHGIRRHIKQNQQALAMATEAPNPDDTANDQLATVNAGASHVEQQLKPIVGAGKAKEWRLEQLEKANTRMAGVMDAQDKQNLGEDRQRGVQAEQDAQEAAFGGGGKRPDLVPGSVADEQQQDTQQRFQAMQEEAAAANAAAAQERENSWQEHNFAGGRGPASSALEMEARREEAAQAHQAEVNQEALASAPNTDSRFNSAQIGAAEEQAQQAAAAAALAPHVEAAKKTAGARDAAIERAGAVPGNTALHTALADAQQAFEAHKTQETTRARNQALKAVNDTEAMLEHQRMFQELRTVATVPNAARGSGYSIDPNQNVMNMGGEEVTRLHKGLRAIAGMKRSQQTRALRALAAQFGHKSIGRNALEEYANRLESPNEAERFNAAYHPLDAWRENAATENNGAKPQSATNEAAANNTAIAQGTNEGATTAVSTGQEDANRKVISNLSKAMDAYRGILKSTAAHGPRTQASVKAVRAAYEQVVAAQKAVNAAEEAANANAKAAGNGQTFNRERAVPPGWRSSEEKFNEQAAALVMPEEDQRNYGPHEQNKEDRQYVFEHYVYDTKPGLHNDEGTFTTKGENAAWLDSIMQARKDAKAKPNQTNVRRIANAKAALAWAEREHGADYKLADKRYAELQKIRERAAEIHDKTQEEKTRERRQLLHEMKVQFARDHGVAAADRMAQEWAAAHGEDLQADAPVNTMDRKEERKLNQQIRKLLPKAAKRTQETVKAAKAVAKATKTARPTDLNMEVGPEDLVSEPLMEVMKANNAAAVLDHIAKNGSTAGNRALARKIQRLNLKTKFEYRDEESRNDEGMLRGGVYQRSIDKVSIFRNGETEHAVLHEFVHAATAGRLSRALAAAEIPPSRRTAEEHALVADLYDLRSIMAEAKALDRSNAYGFKNEYEFVAEAYSSPRFLASIARRFTEWVKSVLGIRPMSDRELESAVSRAIRASEKFFTGEAPTTTPHLMPELENASPLERVESMWAHLWGMIPRLEQASFSGDAPNSLHNDIRIYQQNFSVILKSWKETAENIKRGVADGWIKPEKAAEMFAAQDRRISSHINRIQGMIDKANDLLPPTMPELNLPAAMTQRVDKFMASSDTLSNIPNNLRSAVISLSSALQLGKRFEKSEYAPLRAFGEKLKRIEAVNDLRAQIMQEMGSASYALSRSLELAMKKLPTKLAKLAMGRKLAHVGLEMSRLNIDLNKNYDENQQAGARLDATPAMKAHVNNLHAEYRALPPQFRIPMDSTFAMNRKMYIQQAATTLAVYMGTRQDAEVKALLAPLIAKLDILDPSLSANQTPMNHPQGELPYHLDRYTEELDNRIKAAFDTLRGNPKLKNHATDIIEKYYRSAVANPYQHLGRNGNNFVEFDIANTPTALKIVQQLVEPYGKVVGEPTALSRHVFMRFENPTQWGALIKELEKVKAAGHIEEFGHGNLLDAGVIENIKGVDQFVHSMKSALESRFVFKNSASDEEKRAAKEVSEFVMRLGLDMTQDTSARKSLVQRKDGGVLGFEGDFLRNYDARARSMVAMLASTYAAPRYADEFNDMTKDVEAMQSMPNIKLQPAAQAALASAKQRYLNTLNPVETPTIDAVKALGHAYYLGMSPAYYLTNAMQPWHLTLPILGARYGFVRTAKAMAGATAKGFAIIRATVSAGYAEGNQLGGFSGAMFGVLDAPLVLAKAGLSPAQAEFIKTMIRRGAMNETQGHEQGRVAEGGSPGFAATMKMVSMGAHYGEVLNRITAGLAAFDMELATSKSEAKATAAGIDSVKQTQYSYSDRSNAPALGRHGFAGKVTPLFTQFMSYSFQTMELLYRLARDSTKGIPADLPPAEYAQWKADQKIARAGLGGVLASTSVLAGTLGLPFAAVLARIVDAFGDDDDPSDMKVAYRRGLANVFGKDVGELIAHGVPQAVLGAATTSRMGLGDLLPGSRFLTDRRDIKDRMRDGALNMAGPGVSAGVDIATGVEHMLDGRVGDGLIEMLPLSLRNVAKAYKMADVGYTNATGNQIPIPVTGAAIATQAIGFTPGVKAEQSEVNFAFKTRDTLLKQERGRIANKAYIEMERNKELSPGRIEEVQAWNVKNPAYKIDLAAALAARQKARGVAEVSGTDIPAAMRYLPLLKQYDYANTR